MKFIYGVLASVIEFVWGSDDRPRTTKWLFLADVESDESRKYLRSVRWARHFKEEEAEAAGRPRKKEGARHRGTSTRRKFCHPTNPGSAARLWLAFYRIIYCCELTAACLSCRAGPCHRHDLFRAHAHACYWWIPPLWNISALGTNLLRGSSNPLYLVLCSW